MGYPIREEHADCCYHVGTRGNNQRPIYRDAGSRVMFLVRLGIVARRFDWQILAYCLMTNHYHLVLKLGEFGLARRDAGLNGGYASAFNADSPSSITCSAGALLEPRTRRRGRRLGDEPVHRAQPGAEGDDALPEEWRWSSYRATVGLARQEAFHNPDEIWRLFDDQPRVAMDAYGRFVNEALLETRPVSDTGVT